MPKSKPESKPTEKKKSKKPSVNPLKMAADGWKEIWQDAKKALK